ncbi:DUF2303 family protein [Nocardia asiatica]|uniref:DUF2303 family protein n=1 Tax=Nocardia asiatica TaxID=209252 RepID=UPI00245674CA|nr:DUF2303 family protein [Nocardia asiatica]
MNQPLTAIASAGTEAAAVADIAEDNERFAQEITPAHGLLHVNILRDGDQLDVSSYEQYLSAPSRPRGSMIVTEPGNFTTLLGIDRHHRAMVFADETRNSLTAIIDWQEWRDHRIVLQLTPSDQFKRWSERSGKWFSQLEFAELLEDFASDIYEPAAADLIEIAQDFQAARQVTFESSKRLDNGAVSFKFREDIDAKAGNAGQLEIPEKFLLRIPVWRGGDYIEVTALLRYRIERDQLRLGFKVPGLDDIRLQAFATAVSDVITELDPEHGHYVVFGPSPTVISPLP